MRQLDLLIDVVGGQVATLVSAPDDLATFGGTGYVCFAGGGVNRYGVDVVIGADETYSQARWMTERGAILISLDTPGTGDSVMDAEEVTREAAELAAHHAIIEVVRRLRTGEADSAVPPLDLATLIGTGSSLGGHVLMGVQAQHEIFDGVAALGSSFTWTRLALKEGQEYPYRAASASTLLRGVVVATDPIRNDYWSDVPSAVIEIDSTDAPAAKWRTGQLNFAAEMLLPFASARQAARVRVPALLMYGQRDVTVEPLQDVTVFRSAPSVALLIAPATGHSHTFSTNRTMIWHRLLQFGREVAELRDLGFPGQNAST